MAYSNLWPLAAPGEIECGGVGTECLKLRVVTNDTMIHMVSKHPGFFLQAVVRDDA